MAEQQKDIQIWHTYNPTEAHYSRYRPATIASAYKIGDVYQSLTMGRWNADFYVEEDYGHLCNKEEELAMKFVRSMFIYNSIAYYNYALDLSWQMIWYYYYTDTFDLILNEQLYNSLSKDCNLENLNKLLDMRIVYPSSEAEIAKKIKSIINNFFEEVIVSKLRNKYNYLKHRGCFYVQGLGINDNKSKLFSINDKRMKLLNREELDLNEALDMLIQYDDKFVEYFNNIIKLLMPKDYHNKNLDILSQFLSEYTSN